MKKPAVVKQINKIINGNRECEEVFVNDLSSASCWAIRIGNGIASVLFFSRLVTSFLLHLQRTLHNAANNNNK